jgi:hypothetical protein
LPGTTTDCTSFRKSSLAPVQVEDAITTRAVPRSTAITDQVANDDVSKADNHDRRKTVLRTFTFSVCATVPQYASTAAV